MANKNKKTIALSLALGMTLLGAAAMNNAEAASKTGFEAKSAATPQVANHSGDHKCGSSKCGAKGGDHKCGAKDGDKKCGSKGGEHKCGAKDGDKKCGSKGGAKSCGAASCGSKGGKH